MNPNMYPYPCACPYIDAVIRVSIHPPPIDISIDTRVYVSIHTFYLPVHIFIYTLYIGSLCMYMSTYICICVYIY